MIGTIISLFIALVCVAGIIMIIARRWHALTSIDLEHIPAERDARTKKKILTDRLKRNFYQLKTKVVEKGSPLFSRLADGIVDASHRLQGAIEAAAHRKHIQKDEAAGVAPTESTILSRLVRDADAYLERGEYADAEKRYIDAIALDPKNLETYAGLAILYKAQKEWASAQEVLEYLRDHLRDYADVGEDASAQSAYTMRLAESLMQLCEVYALQEKMEEAQASTEEALSLQPSNPKFLDAGLELYIILGKQKEARQLLKRLKAANPENQKIEGFEDRIKAL
ncbi:tetratricopeptide repeat protein [Candidatus Uhrbacteria bacterium]|nr:tetratricopeptide repeat protein [Candidatus Uhrbacteria bacterium]